MQKVSPFLWFDSEAEEAAGFYVSLFPNSSVTRVTRGPDGRAFAVSFVLDGMEVQAMNAGPMFPFTEAFSFFVDVSNQAEIDELWEKLLSGGGQESQCGWLKDRWGLSWQVVPSVLGPLLADPDPERAARVNKALMGMVKLDIAALTAAADA